LTTHFPFDTSCQLYFTHIDIVEFLQVKVLNNLYPIGQFLVAQANGSVAPSASGGNSGGVDTHSSTAAPSNGSAPPQGGFLGAGGMQPMIMIVLMFAVFYLLLIRPQQKKAKEHQKMIDGIGKGEEIVTNGGIIGKVISVSGGVLTLEIADKVRIRVLRNQISGKFDKKDSNSADSKNKSDSKVEKK
jgi:preprotein translocase subunit YajC